jgi:hypothetical protein
MSSAKRPDIELQVQTQEGTLDAQNQNSSTTNAFPEIPQPEIVPRRTWKLFSSGFSFFVAGVNDGSMGALLPYMLKEYDIGTSFIAIL